MLMLRVLSAGQMLDAENRAVADAGVTLGDLMDAAGTAVAHEAARRCPEGRILVLSGPGNNGGDGWVAARVLHGSGREVRVAAVRHPDTLKGIAGEAARRAIESGVAWRAVTDAPGDDAMDAELVIDAMLGTGSMLPIRPPLDRWCDALNSSGVEVLSVDCPTGVDPDTGACDRFAVQADATVTFTALKPGLVLFPGATHAGDIIVADVGVPRDLVDGVDAPEVWLAEEYARLLPRPMPDAHKNQRGRVLVIAGSGFYPGAAILAARGAMRGGAGYVTLAVLESIVGIAQTHLVAVPVVGLPAAGKVFSSAAASVARDLATEFDAVVIGPGFTVADGAAATARRLVSAIDRPIVLDADGLNAFVDHVALIEARTAPTVLTPHPGELGRLLGLSSDDVQKDRISSSARLAGAQRTVVLKGAGTVTSGEGRQVINTSGSVALATAGTGDVLSGMVGALLAQGLSPFHAGALGAYLHGRAGECAAADFTPLCVTAEDLPDYVPVAVAGLLEGW